MISIPSKNESDPSLTWKIYLQRLPTSPWVIVANFDSFVLAASHAEVLRKIIRTARFAVGCESPPESQALLESEQRCQVVIRNLEPFGIDTTLAQEVAIVLIYKPLPWSISEQAVIKRAWYARMEVSHPFRRIDSHGRDVTDLPGLWDESDLQVETESGGASFLESFGLDTALAQEAAIVLSDKTLPWSVSEQVLAKQALWAVLAAEAIDPDPIEPEVTEFSVPVPGDPDYDY